MRIVSGFQPTGQLHIGNYLGAIQNGVLLQKDNDCIFFIVDLHAITVSYDSKQLKENTLIAAADLMACGIDPKKSILFVQSDISGHSELSYLLSCLTSFGDLSRMTQFKEKSKQQKDFVSAGLFYYPVLMAADILLYNAEGVPVGEDQLQHIELTRRIAERFNKTYGEFFKLPKALMLNEEISRIMSIKDSSSKMAKSNPESCLFLSDSPDDIRRKLKSAVTDSGKEVKYDLKKKPAISNLISIYKGFSGKPFGEIAKEFEDSSYVDFKAKLADLVVENLNPIREKRNELLKDKGELSKILKENASRAGQIASENLKVIKEKMGF